MEIACPTHDLLLMAFRQNEILLREISEQFLSGIKTVGHMQRHIFLVSILIAIGSIGIEFGSPAAVEHIDRAVSFQVLTETALPFHDTFDRIGHGHIDIQHITSADGAFRYTRVGADLDIGDVLGFHLGQYQSHVAVDRRIVDAKVIALDHVLKTAYEQLRHHLQHVRQRLFSRQLHALRINHRPVRHHLNDRLTLLSHHSGRNQPTHHPYTKPLQKTYLAR